MSLSDVQCVEAFHLVFLRVFESKVDRSLYVVKGGVNVRAWFGSVRYSEDLDVDARGGEPFQLRDDVEAILRAPTFDRLLRSQDLAIGTVTRPKQTDTTQRWKFELIAGGRSLHTKIEFSRRPSGGDHLLEPVLSEIVKPYGIPAPTLFHYTAAAAVQQKIRALVGRRETQARDVWDLDHLLRTQQPEIANLDPATREALPAALERVLDMSFDDFKAQVVSYLSPDDQDLYGTLDAWSAIKDLVVERLLGLPQ